MNNNNNNSSRCNHYTNQYIRNKQVIQNTTGIENVFDALYNVPFGTFKIDLLVYVDMICNEYILRWKRMSEHQNNLGTTLFHSFIVEKTRDTNGLLKVHVVSTWQNYCYKPTTLTFKEAGFVDWLNRFRNVINKLESGDLRCDTAKSIQTLFIAQKDRKPNFKPFYFNDKNLMRYHRNRFHNIELSATLYV